MQPRIAVRSLRWRACQLRASPAAWVAGCGVAGASQRRGRGAQACAGQLRGWWGSRARRRRPQAARAGAPARRRRRHAPAAWPSRRPRQSRRLSALQTPTPSRCRCYIRRRRTWRGMRTAAALNAPPSRPRRRGGGSGALWRAGPHACARWRHRLAHVPPACAREGRACDARRAPDLVARRHRPPLHAASRLRCCARACAAAAFTRRAALMPPGARHTGAPRALNALEFAAARALEVRFSLHRTRKHGMLI